MGYLDFLNSDDEENDDGEERGNLSRSTRNRYIMNLGQSSNEPKYNYQSGKVINSYSDTSQHIGSRIGSYGDEDRVKEYLDLARQPSPSEKIYNDYLSRRPKEENYKPSFGRTLLAALAGGIGGMTRNPYIMGLGSRILNAPYDKAMEDYKDEGQLITNRARSADAAMQRDVAAKKFDIEESRRRQDAQFGNEMEQARFEEAQKNKESANQRQTQKDIQAQKDKERDFQLRERALNESSALRRQNAEEMSGLRQQNQNIKLQEKRAKLQSNRAQFATVRAHQMIRSKPEYAQYFTDPNDPEDFSLKKDIPDSKRQEIEFLIRDAEDTLKKSYGLPGAFSAQGYSDVNEEE